VADDLRTIRRPDNVSNASTPTELDIARRKQWAAAMIRAADGPIPRYGDAAWHAMVETDRRRVASAVRAAECHQQECDDLVTRLHREIADGRAVFEQLEVEDFTEMAKGVRRLASVPTYAELADRRGQPERAERARARARRMREDAS